MCNLSQDVFEKGMEKEKRNTILRMYNAGFTKEVIAQIVELSIDEIAYVLTQISQNPTEQ